MVPDLVGGGCLLSAQPIWVSISYIWVITYLTTLEMLIETH